MKWSCPHHHSRDEDHHHESIRFTVPVRATFLRKDLYLGRCTNSELLFLLDEEICHPLL